MKEIMRPTDGITIGYLALRTGIAVSALRYYEKQGLVSAARTSGGQRQFQRADIRRLSFIQICQQFGFSLDEIKERLATLPDGRTPNKKDWTGISKAIADRLDSQIASLTKMRDDLDSCIGCGCLSLQKCALYNPRDRARQKGAGPRYLLGDSADVD